MRVLVLLSGSGSNFQALLGAAAHNSAADIVGVISDQPGAYGLARARSAGVATSVLAAQPHETRTAYDCRLAHAIQAYTPDLILLAGFMRIMTAPLVEKYQGRMLNIHPSLLPAYKGLNTHQRVLENHDAHHGCSVHFVTPDLDDGPVILQARCPIFPGDDADSLRQRVHALEHQIYPQVMAWFCQGRLALHPQGAYLDGQKLPASGLCYSDHMEL